MSQTYVTDVDAVSPGAEIGLDTEHSSPPTAAYVGKDDQLWIEIASSPVNPSAIISARLLMPDGSIVPNQWTIAPPGARNGFWTAIPLPECFILSIAATLNTSSATQNMWAQLVISRGNPVGGVISQVLCEGYATNTRAISWPTGVNTDPVNGVGAIRSITGTIPAPGVDISETVPANAKWRLAAVRFRLTTSAVVGVRVVMLIITDGTNTVYNMAVNIGQAASAVVEYNYADGMALTSNSVSQQDCPLPRQLFMMPNWKLTTLTSAIQVGDQFSLFQYVVEEWLLP